METFIAYQDAAFLADDIKAETGQNTQGGVRFDKRLDNHFIGANLTVFQTNIDDYIAEEYQPANQSYLIYNLGDVEIKVSRQAYLTVTRCLTASFLMLVQIPKQRHRRRCCGWQWTQY